MIYCKIDNGVVIDRALFAAAMPDDWPAREAWVASEDAQIGWGYIDGAFVAPPPLELPPAPAFPNLEPDQFWFGLRAAGYEEDVRAWVANLNEPGTEDNPNPAYDPVTWAWASAKLEYAKYFERDHPLVLAAQQAIGISEAELDALWQFAAA